MGNNIANNHSNNISISNIHSASVLCLMNVSISVISCKQLFILLTRPNVSLVALLFSRPYWVVRSGLWYDVLSVCLSSVCLWRFVLWLNGTSYIYRGSAMVPLDRALVSSYRLSIVTMSLSAAVWPQFATQSFLQHHVYRNSLLLIYFTDTGSSTISTNFDWPKSVTKLSNISGRTVPN